MVPIFVVLTIIMAWCCYLRFTTFMQRQRIEWVEVFESTQETSRTISRKQAKENLRKFNELTSDGNSVVKGSSRFDQHWYDQREI